MYPLIKLRNSASFHRTLITNWHLTIVKITTLIQRSQTFNQANKKI